jgi:protein involved in polysaccharide export with SLBB domain
VGASSLVAALAGCIGTRIVYPVMPTPEERAEFDAAGPADVEAQELEVAAMRVAGPYRVVPGDLLAIELPPEVDVDQAKAEGAPPSVAFKCRVRDDGTVLLPMIGAREVKGRTTAEVEELLAGAFVDPARLNERPNVVVTVAEHSTRSVVVVGAVNQPGVHELRSDRMTVVGALMEAGGIKADRGARSIRVLGEGAAARELGVRLGEVLIEDVALVGGETIVVEPAPDRSFSVIGLVKKTGVFQYPAPRRYNLMQALATAGGVDENAAPRYATIYRVKADGTVVGATFKIDGTSLEDASNVVIKDGDVIAVDHTQGSWLRAFFSQVFGFRASVNVSSATSPTL